ncbi:RB1-inducible coiled-coil protein 1 isoform X2 [Thrips palmi]|nr:RB1-inducible coiled-coil protein 1 isoform X2 [Thrips palmi]XP_034234485.1 RB1-inducible coiled-coil protein 1 isoform X2 [Thrips palmi]
MLYIFHVDTGSMMTFEMNLALESVAHLKEVIERACRIPPEKQVLLISGGLSLEPTARVCSYSAGTDTNPIFLFSKSSIESVSPPSPSIDYGSDMDLKEQVDASLSLPASYNTVVVRAQLAQQFCELARDQTRICERLVHDQHLQQQGWAAVVANLEDSVSVFRNQGEVFEQSYQQHLESRGQYVDLLENFNEVLVTLSKIPILPGLLASAVESMQGTDAKSKDDEISEEEAALPQENSASSMSAVATHDESEPMAVSKKSNNSCGEDWQRRHEEKAVTLLQWISTKDNQSTLEQMVDQCGRGLEQLDERVLEELRANVQNALEAATKTDMKDIKGLEERLYGLEQLMFESKRIVQEQTDLATAFQQNQVRANNLGDTSILPDLCASHRRQLHVMSQNHTRLRDIRKRCNRAKEELSVNLYHRLKWIMYVENRMCDVASKLMIYHENLKRLRRHLEVVRQIQMAPQMYVCAVGEVVRRRTFSQAFLSWAGQLASQLQAVHSEELGRRRDFQTRFEGHFLNTLFPGMEDCPPPFATQAPVAFDTMLPKLSKEDVDRLRIDVPSLAMSLTVPELGQIAKLFAKYTPKSQKSIDKNNAAIENQLVTAVTSANLECTDLKAEKQSAEQICDPVSGSSTASPNSLPLRDDREFESETDTEEFEKVGQSPIDMDRIATTVATSEVGVQSVCYQDIGIQCNSRQIPPQTPSGHSGDSFSMSMDKDVCDLPKANLVEVGIQFDGESEASVLCGSESPSDVPTPSTSSSLFPATDSGIQCDNLLGSCLRISSTVSQGAADVAVQVSSLEACASPLPRLIAIGSQCEFSSSPTTAADVAVQCTSPSSATSSLIVDRSWPIRGPRLHSASELRSHVATQCSSPILLSPSQTHGQHVTAEFLATEFYMDESMPSSFTESNSLRSHNVSDIDKPIQDSQTLVRLLQDNLGNAQLQVERAKAQLSSVEKVALAATESLRAELGQIRGQVAVEREDFLKLLDTFKVAWEQLLSAGNFAHSAANHLDLKVELERERRAMSAKDDLIRTLTQSVEERTATVEQLEASLRQRLMVEEEQRAQAEQLQRRLEETESSGNDSEQLRCSELERRLEELENDKTHYIELQTRLDSISKDTVADLNRALEEQKASLELLHQQRMKQLQEEFEVDKARALKDMSDQLSRDHHSELEGLRSRFRLMACASSERSSSESSLEKTEGARSSKVDVDLEVLLREKDLAVQAAVQETEKRLHSGFEAKLQQELRNIRLKMEAEKQVWFNDAVRRVVEVKERHLREREAVLKEECQKHKDTIRRITDEAGPSSGNSDNSGVVWQLQDRINQLETELTEARSRSGAMGISVAIDSSENVTSRDAATSPEPLSLKKNLTCSANNLLQQGKISILTCFPGDAVLVVWNDTHQNYVILQESSTLFFVHSDSLESLGLSLKTDGGRRKIYNTAEVIEKEYCHARKSENRYRVPKGTKFYRVKVRPLQEDSLMLRSSCRSKVQPQHLQHSLLHQPEEIKKVDISVANESEAVSLPCAASGPLSGSSASSLPDMAITDASQ